MSTTLIATQIATEASPVGQIWAAAITGLAALIAVVVNAHSNPLRKAERLTEILTRMLPSSEQRLIEDLRDDYLSSWALEQMAPTYRGKQVITCVGYGLGALVFLAWFAYSVTFQYVLWTWLIYLAGIMIVASTVLVHARRTNLITRWIEHERANRWMRRPHHTRLR